MRRLLDDDVAGFRRGDFRLRGLNFGQPFFLLFDRGIFRRTLAGADGTKLRLCCGGQGAHDANTKYYAVDFDHYSVHRP